jgi:hypothetical protein
VPHLPALVRFCAVRGIAVTATASQRGGTTVQVDGVIYAEGFNRPTFQQTLECVNDCIARAKSLLAGGAPRATAPVPCFHAPARGSQRCH